MPALKYVNFRVSPGASHHRAAERSQRKIRAADGRIAEQVSGISRPCARFVSRGSIITSNSGGTRSVNLDISRGPNLGAIYDAALSAYRRAEDVFDNPRIARPLPLRCRSHSRWSSFAPTGRAPAELGMDARRRSVSRWPRSPTVPSSTSS